MANAAPHKSRPDNNEHPVVATTKARQANTLRVMRYVLGFSLALGVIAFTILLLMYFGS
ncbi:MAG: hypothetical protein ACT4OG_01555 [Alphaproteobacteria bacterium]